MSNRRVSARALATGAVMLFAARRAAAAEGGLEIIPDPSVLIPLIVGFAILVPIINQLLLRPLLGVLEERDEKIAGARQRAEKIAVEADAMESRYRQAVDDVRTHAEQERQAELSGARSEETERVRGARAEAESRLEAARSEIGAALETARASLRASAEELARQAAQQILGRGLK
ncbi:MAG: hypothetical protein JSU66_01220 [Deltaproteobacteria bacterium]|nr:MAG: hypothetical protein JSU66_01220 [Deltaproteobacteria bacterium]